MLNVERRFRYGYLVGCVVAMLTTEGLDRALAIDRWLAGLVGVALGLGIAVLLERRAARRRPEPPVP